MRPFCVAAGCLVMGSAYADWTFTNLHPSGQFSSVANAADDVGQAGTVQTSSGDHASLWYSSPESWTDLHPTGATYSRVYGAGTGQQTGVARIGGQDRAALWSGYAGSFEDLTPSWATSGAIAYNCANGQQVGYATSGATIHATLWAGTAASVVDIHPVGASDSEAHGTDGFTQVGTATFGGVSHAGYWSGTASSWVDINPASGSLFSEGAGVDGAQQVGTVRTSLGNRASLWSGSAGSWVNLHPTSAGVSRAVGVANGVQVGHAIFGGSLATSGFPGTWVGGTPHAYLWTGSAASGIDLSGYLTGFASSYATDVSFFLGRYYITGGGIDETTGTSRAWTLMATVTPEPGTYAVLGLGVAAVLRRRRKS